MPTRTKQARSGRHAEPYNPPEISVAEIDRRIAGDRERRQRIADQHARMWPLPEGGGW